MFELEKHNTFFERLGQEYPSIVQNIEILYENKLLLDANFHRPKIFILHLNNCLRSIDFFVQLSRKNAPTWFKSSAKEYLATKEKELAIIRRLRNLSAHQKLIVPDESFVVGLYKIKSETEYTLKIGMGDHNRPGKYSLDLTLKNTEDVFHDLLVFHSMVMMDLEHSALSECLGVTRNWYFRVDYKMGNEPRVEVVDVYNLVSMFIGHTLDFVCKAYSKHKDIKFSPMFSPSPLSVYNFINTVLEVDLYPELFETWWGEKIERLNFGMLVNRLDADKLDAINSFHVREYGKACKSKEEYIDTLKMFRDMTVYEVFEDANIYKFYSFVSLNHWHVKSFYKLSLANRKNLGPSKILGFQRVGKALLDEYRSKDLEQDPFTIHEIHESFVAYADDILENI